MASEIYVAVSLERNTLGFQFRALFEPMRSRAPLGVYNTMAGRGRFHPYGSENLANLTRMSGLSSERGYITISGDHPFRNGRHYFNYSFCKFIHDWIGNKSLIGF